MTSQREQLAESAVGEPLQRLADALRDAEQLRAPIAPPSQTHPGLSVDQAYAVQRVNMTRRLAAGERRIGCKVGLTSLAMQRQLGVDSPDFGVLTDKMRIADRGELNLDQLIAPRLEPEFAFRIGHDLAPWASRDDVIAAIDGVAVALEVIDSRVANWRIGLADTIADNASSARVVIGDFVQTTPQLLGALPETTVTMRRDDETVAAGPGSAVLGDPLNAIVWLAEALGEYGEAFAVGDVVLAGAVDAAVAVSAPGHWVAEASGLPAVALRTVQSRAKVRCPVPMGNICRPRGLSQSLDVSGLVDVHTGLVDRSIFTDHRLYEQEQARVFAPSWLFLGHEDQLQKPGDFFTTYMGGDPVIVTKDKSGTIRAFLNSCRHRGARVLRADYGKTRAFTCTYHGWSYDLEGKLISVPNEMGYADSAFDRADWGLVEVAQLEVVLGLIFATWNPQAPALDDQLGDMRWYMEAFLDRDSEGTTVVGGITKWILKGNWKLAAEQFGTDWYHVNMSHASALMVLSPTGKGPRQEIVETPGRQYSDDRGNGTGFPTHPKSRFDAQPVHEHYDYAALRERLGAARVEGPLTTGHATVFPNFSYLPINGSIRVWHPKGPDEIEIWAWTVLDKAMPEHVREAQRLYNLRTFGPSGIFEQDDGENWSEIQAISRGWRTNTVPLNYQMGLGSERDDGVHPGSTSELYSDAAGRRFYKRWAELMNTPAWHEEA